MFFKKYQNLWINLKVSKVVYKKKMVNIYCKSSTRCSRINKQVLELVASRNRRGKSGLHRAGRQLMAAGRDSKESATENKPPYLYGKGEKVV